MEQFGLAEIVFIPSGTPPHKKVAGRVDKEMRYTMVKDAISTTPYFSVSRIEIDRHGPSYTIDTIEAMREVYPQGLCFIVGADLLADIETWKKPEVLLRSIPFVVAPRARITREAFTSPRFGGARIHWLRMQQVDLSSSWVRKRIRQGQPIEKWVPEEVVKYIRQHGLYQDRKLSRVH
jgi:nicotinate-nucleotide adenylyltransferase